jgi:hypothetical protein
MKPPPRLIDDGAIAPELRADLERVAARSAPYDAVAGLSDFQRAIAAAPAEPSGIASRLGSSGVKIAALSAAAAVLTAAAVFAWTEIARTPVSPKPATVPLPRMSASPPTPQPAQPQRAPSVQLRPVQLRPVQAAPAPAAEAVQRGATPAGLRGTAPDEALQREIAQLGRVKQLLPGEPQRAYLLAQAGHREFRTGMLRHEREGLAILALWQLRRDAEAEQRTRSFLVRYPESPLREQLARRLERAAGRVTQEP